MNKIYRIIDANVNRAAEGLRVLEDMARFHYNEKSISGELKKLRHDVRDSIMELIDKCLSARDSENDPGLIISKEMKLDKRVLNKESVTANFKRIQEALRTVEENMKLIDNYITAKKYEEFRFRSYTLEKKYYIIDSGNEKRKKLDTDIYGIVSEEFSKGRSNIETVKSMINCGIKIIQYSQKRKSMLRKYNECIRIREMTRNAGVTFIINDHIDLALLVEADGVHTGQDSLPVKEVRKIAGEDIIIGVSTHTPEQAEKAVENGADYIFAGPVFETYQKKDTYIPAGLKFLRYVVNNINIPIVAIGGIKEHNVEKVKATGAKCIAMTEITAVENMAEKIKSIRNKLKKSPTIHS